MIHPQVAAGVFTRITLFVLLLPLLVALGGCSLFGIATKGNLNELADQQNQQQQQLQTQVDQSEQKMDSRVTQVEDKTMRIDQDLAVYEAEIQAAKVQLQSIALDLDAFESDLEKASTNSKHALRIHHETVISERDRLQNRLNEINALILSLEQLRTTEPEGIVTPVPGGLIVPEKKEGTGGSVDAAQASNETSVWNNKRSGGN